MCVLLVDSLILCYLGNFTSSGPWYWGLGRLSYWITRRSEDLGLQFLRVLYPQWRNSLFLYFFFDFSFFPGSLTEVSGSAGFEVTKHGKAFLFFPWALLEPEVNLGDLPMPSFCIRMFSFLEFWYQQRDFIFGFFWHFLLLLCWPRSSHTLGSLHLGVPDSFAGLRLAVGPCHL